MEISSKNAFFSCIKNISSHPKTERNLNVQIWRGQIQEGEHLEEKKYFEMKSEISNLVISIQIYI